MILTTDLDYYVSPSGSNSNNGLSPSTPFQTIQKAFDTLAGSYLDGHAITIRLADGQYADPVVLTQGWFGGAVTLLGNGSFPENTELRVTANTHTFNVLFARFDTLVLKGVKLTNVNNGGYTLRHEGLGVIEVDNIICGPSGDYTQLKAQGTGAVIRAVGKYGISNGGLAHCEGRGHGLFTVRTGIEVNLLDAVSYSHGFAYASRLGGVSLAGVDFTGRGVTGDRWQARWNGVIYDPGIPGSLTGVEADGGVKV